MWGTTALAGATSWIHVDANGLATQVENVAGAKYWVLLRRCHKNAQTDGHSHTSSVGIYPQDWEPWTAGKDLFEHEGLLLTPGNVL